MKVHADLEMNHGTTKAELIAALDGVPDEAVISIDKHEAGWGGNDWYTMKLTWEVGNGKPVYNQKVHGEDEWGGYYR
jgi:hypothetical protein